MSQEQTPTTFFRLDIVIVLCVLGLMALGIAFIYSSGVTSEGIQVSSEWIRQLVWAISGVVLMIVFAVVDYRRWRQWAFIVYGLSLLSLIVVLLAGKYVKGARSWLGFGSVGIQPSEFAKLALIITLAWWLEERSRSGVRVWLGTLVLTTIPMGLILMQPDLGTAIVFIPILIGICFVAGMPLKFLILPMIVGILSCLGILGYAWSEHIARTPLGFFRMFSEPMLIQTAFPALIALVFLTFLARLFFKRFYFCVLTSVFSIIAASYACIVAVVKVLKDYQMMRLVVFLDPQTDPRGAGWHIIQSVTAVGSGGALGKGFLRGTQSLYRYLPEQSTDFIFSILAEETGFLGSLTIFGLFGIIILRSLYIAYTSQDKFGTYMAVGIVAMVGYHVIQNIGMAIGVMPITGIPLFFLSYGGSSLWVILMSMGLLLSIHYRRYRS